jgi:hypothetical protein
VRCQPDGKAASSRRTCMLGGDWLVGVEPALAEEAESHLGRREGASLFGDRPPALVSEN